MPKAALVLVSLTLAGCCMGRGRSTSTETIVISGPGFTPDPTTSSGQAGGAMLASSLAPNDGCVGSIPNEPQHMLRLRSTLPLLRVLVNSTDDMTLVVRAPDGTFHCNDDSGDPTNGLNPMLDISGAPAGDYAIYVGAYGEQAMLVTYSIGFTTTPNTYPSQVIR
jgi:hypothetical protein